MLVLALDTTTRAGSSALARDGVLLREQASDATRPQASRLPSELMALLDDEHLVLGDVDVFAVATGPGSFTGMRVGIATMQGLAFAAGKPLIGVSALDALARHVIDDAARIFPPSREAAADGRSLGGGGTVRHLVATWVDAWRGEVYAALYARGREVEAPSVESPRAILERLRAESVAPGPPEGGRYESSARPGGSSRVTFIGDGAEAHATTIRAALGDAAAIADPVAPLLAGTIAAFATDAARAGYMPLPHAIRPLYVRHPDAELARNARTGR